MLPCKRLLFGGEVSGRSGIFKPLKEDNFVRVVFVASEGVPFSKTGGLADVVGALPKALAKLGHELEVVLPRYRITKPASPRLGCKA